MAALRAVLLQVAATADLLVVAAAGTEVLLEGCLRAEAVLVRRLVVDMERHLPAVTEEAAGMVRPAAVVSGRKVLVQADR